jgi:hypothetical protein
MEDLQTETQDALAAAKDQIAYRSIACLFSIK